MRTLALAFRYLWSRPLTAALNLFLLSLAIASITFVVLANHQVNRAFERDLAGIDAVVGAKGSPLQLIMAGVFHLDVPPGNVKLSDVEKLARLAQVNRVIPMALGDSFRGFRIVGTTEAYVAHYGARLAAGSLWGGEMEAVLGAEVAAATGLAPGASFSGSHGLAAGGSDHAEEPYRVAGLLAPCNCVLDRLILTSLDSVWHVHGKEESEDREVTMALVTYKTPLAAASFPRHVNTQTPMQAAAPAIEVTRLLRLVGVGTEVLRWVGAVLLFTAALSVFIALWGAVRERRADLALLRMLGVPPARVGAILLCEAAWLATLGSAIGLVGGHALMALVASMLQAQQSLPVSGWALAPGEWWIPLAALGAALAAALVPAVSAYRVDVAELLRAR